jgi:L-malate glycosyltransferase
MTPARRIVQLHAGFADGDAISRESRILHGLFQKFGYESRLYAVGGRISPTMTELCRPLDEYRNEPGDIVVHHYGVASPATEAFLNAAGPKILVYHNITPAEFFRGFDDDLAVRLAAARADLATVARRSDAVWAVSEFDAAEVAGLGIANVRVFPLLFSTQDFDLPPDPRIARLFAEPMKNILFVGRIAPNKTIEDLILAFAWYKRRINRRSRLLIVGSQRTTPRYYAMLRMLAMEMGLQDVFFEGFASPAGLCTYYGHADVFVCPSRHEGYCLPLVEAMFKGVPVIARNCGGMPEAMGGAGVLYDDLAPGELAELIHRVIEDAPLRTRILDSERDRVSEILRRKPEDELRQHLDCVLRNGR